MPDGNVFLKGISRWRCVSAAFFLGCIAVIDFVLVRLGGREKNSLKSTLEKKKKKKTTYLQLRWLRCKGGTVLCGTNSGSVPSKLSFPVLSHECTFVRKKASA